MSVSKPAVFNAQIVHAVVQLGACDDQRIHVNIHFICRLHREPRSMLLVDFSVGIDVVMVGLECLQSSPVHVETECSTTS